MVIVTSSPRVVISELKHVIAQIGKDLTEGIVNGLTNDPGAGGTPRDTNHAANNWIASIGKPSNIVDGSREDPSSAAQNAGLASVLSSYNGKDLLHIANNVHYVPLLNDGSSAQAPKAFVQAVVARVLSEVAGQ